MPFIKEPIDRIKPHLSGKILALIEPALSKLTHTGLLKLLAIAMPDASGQEITDFIEGFERLIDEDEAAHQPAPLAPEVEAPKAEA